VSRSLTPARTASPAWAPGSPRGWLIWALGCGFYTYDFLIRIDPGMMVGDLMRDFGVSAAAVGGLSAWYLYSYSVLQIPVGMVLDRFGPRHLLTGAALLTALGCLLFGAAPDFGVARLGRILNGIGGGTAFLGSITLAALWLPPERFAVMSGFTMAIGTLGTLALQVPLAHLVQTAGWRPSLYIIAAIGLLVAVALWTFVRDAPHRVRVGPGRGLGHALRAVAGNRQVWLVAGANCCLSGPMLAFGGLWSVPYLMQVYGFGREVATDVNGAMLVAWGFGGPLAGWLSNRLGRRKPVLIGAVVSAGILWLVLALAPPLPLPALLFLYAAIGIATSGMMIGFTLARELATQETVGAASGVVNTMMTAAGAVTQPLFGWLLDLQWQGDYLGGARAYPSTAFGHAALLFVALLAVGLGLAARARESRCRPVWTTRPA
jgi:MFS family permease